MLKSLAVLVFAAACGSARAAVPEPDVLINDQGMQVVINLPQTRLFLYQDGVLLRSFPVAVGKMLTKTPTGSFDVTGIYRDPSWHGIVPVGIKKDIKDLIDGVYHIEQDPKKRLANARVDRMNEKQLAQEIKRLEKEMMAAARDLDFERAAQARDELKALKQRIFINGE